MTPKLPSVPVLCMCPNCVRNRDAQDRTNIPPHAQNHPDARSWHWNEHPKGKFPKDDVQ